MLAHTLELQGRLVIRYVVTRLDQLDVRTARASAKCNHFDDMVSMPTVQEPRPSSRSPHPALEGPLG
eukprot:9472590-Pyramimonas_sp.AAC.1